MALIISTWHWGTKYGPEYVDRLAAGVSRYYRKPYRWTVFQPEPADHYLVQIPGCLCRLRMFSRDWQAKNGIERGDRIVCMDLDSIVTGPLEPLFERTERFVILRGVNQINPNPFNGSLMMLRAGYHEDIWTDFTLEKATAVPWYEFPDDQAWIHHKLPNAAYWRAGHYSGIYGFQKQGWPRGVELPSDARLVVFPGRRDPIQFIHVPWIQERWLNIKPIGRVGPVPLSSS